MTWKGLQKRYQKKIPLSILVQVTLQVCFAPWNIDECCNVPWMKSYNIDFTFFHFHFQLKKVYPELHLKLPGKKLFGNNFDPGQWYPINYPYEKICTCRRFALHENHEISFDFENVSLSLPQKPFSTHDSGFQCLLCNPFLVDFSSV